MKKYLFKILLKKLETSRKPYGHQFPKFSNELKKSADLIIKEYQDFLKKGKKSIVPIDEFSEAQKDLNLDKKWKALLIFAYGSYNTKVTSEFKGLIDFIEEHKSLIKLVMFSTLEPGKEIKPHKGNNLGVIRLQLGIEVKEPDKCGLQVADKTFHLKEKETLFFDDTFEHSAWNRGSQNRTVLIIDLKKKLHFPYNIFNNLYLKDIQKSDYIKKAFEKV